MVVAASEPEPSTDLAMHPLLLDIASAALLLHMRPQTLRYALEAGDVPGTRVGREWRLWAPAVIGKVLGEQAVRDLANPPPDFEEPVVVGVRELVGLLGLHEKTISKLLRDGDLPGQKVGREWRSYWPAIRERIAQGLPSGGDGA